MLLLARRFATTATLLVLLALPAASQRGTAPNQDAVVAAKELMAVMGAEKQMDVMLAGMLPNMANAFKQMRPDRSREIDEVFGDLARLFMERKKELIDAVAPVYAQHFGAAELKELSAFFRSPIGTKLVAAQPQIMAQSMVIGQQWGQRLGAEIESEARIQLKKKGIDI